MVGFGQPFYNYGTNPYGGQNNGYMAQQPQYGNFYAQPQNVVQNANNGFTQQYQAQQQAQQAPQIPPRTNIAPVASLIDAMSRTSEPNTNMYYADQDQPLIYLVSIDMQGRKTSRTFEIKDVTEQSAKDTVKSSDEQTTQQANDIVMPNIDLSAYATKNDLQALKDEIMGMASAFVAQQPVQHNAQIVAKSKIADKVKTDDKSNKE